MWQALRQELHPSGLEVVTVSLEVSGPEVSRPYIEAAAPEHPSLLDPEHRMDALFGVVNVPNVTWIDEAGTVVRPPEPGWPGERGETPSELGDALGSTSRARTAPPPPADQLDLRTVLGSGQDRASYPDAVRDWASRGADSPYVLRPDEIVARSTPRSAEVSEAAAHFELAEHLWRTGRREPAIAHFRESHRLQPDNWTYKRQAWSLVGHERTGGAYGRFAQGPRPGEEDDWPFASDMTSDLAQLGEGQYYPRTF